MNNQKLQKNKTNIIDLGCGKHKIPGSILENYIGIDIRPFEGVDCVLDIRKDKLPFPDSSIDKIISNNVFEHLGEVIVKKKKKIEANPMDKITYTFDYELQDGLLWCIDECWRVLKPDSCLEFFVPQFPQDSAFIHPDHRRFFVKNSFGFWNVPANGEDKHGYLDRFWFVGLKDDMSKDMIHGKMYPNKPGCSKFSKYVKVKRV